VEGHELVAEFGLRPPRLKARKAKLLEELRIYVCIVISQLAMSFK